jgi:uncharacterized protein YndB with AHSA1/START domain
MKSENQLLPAGAATVTIEIEIEAPVERTWHTMIEDVGKWWRKDFLCYEGSLGMFLEPELGGRLFEKTESGGGFTWGTVISFLPEKRLTYVAQIIPLWGGPAQPVVQIGLKPSASRPNEEATLLTLTDSLIGHVSDALVASLEEGWGLLYGEGGLKFYIESNFQ